MDPFDPSVSDMQHVRDYYGLPLCQPVILLLVSAYRIIAALSIA
jgi:hypothetical protein